MTPEASPRAWSRQKTIALVLILFSGLAVAELTSGGRVPLTELPILSTGESVPCAHPDAAIDSKESHISLATELSFYANDFIRIPVCTASTITARVRGSVARNVGSRLVIGWRDTTLINDDIAGDKHIEVEVPGPGWVIVAFVNDFYNPPDDRNLHIELMSLTTHDTE